MTFSGIPSPPTGLQLHISKETERYKIRLSWTRPRTLFDEIDNDDMQNRVSQHSTPRLHYVVYAYLESETDSLYRNETASLSDVVFIRDLNLPVCNLSALIFYVSAKFDQVGEGNVSSPIGIDPSDADSICRTGKMYSNNF